MQRRTLAKGFLTAAAAAFGSHAIAKGAIPNFKWDEETEVLIAGFGGAGAAAAIEAHDAGAKVLILEKLEAGGGNTSVSAGGIMIPKDKEEAYEYLTKTFEYAGSEMDQELLRTFVDQIVQQREFLLGMAEGSRMGRYGGAGFPTLPHADTIDKYTFMWKELSAGPALFAMYHNAVVNLRKIPVRYNTPAVRLIVDGGRVVGIQAGKEGALKNYRAKKAVILACGGYEYSSEMLSNFAKGMKIHALGCPGNTGDGIKMAQAVGAKLWHMTAYSCPLGTIVPGKKAIASCNMPASGFWVDQNGKRFVNEKSIDTHTCLYAVDLFDPIKHSYPRIPAYLIFDEKALKAGPVAGGITGWLGYREGYIWSKDNSVELKAGLIKSGRTPEELAKAIGIDAEGLKATIAEWNKGVAEGKDALGRPMKNAKGAVLSAPLEGTLYAIELVPSLLNTQGGPRRNVKGQVLNAYGEVIPGLYVAGEMGSMWGHIYQGACNNAEALVFGRLAGKAAAAEKA